MDSNISELVKSGHEIASDLKASCGAVDVRSVAQLISDLASQLEVQLVRSNTLAAENAGLKELIEQHANSVAVCPNCSHEEPSETDDIVALFRSMETPATDDFLAEVRACARKDFIDRIEWIIRNECNPEKTETILNELQSFSETVRQEVAQ